MSDAKQAWDEVGSRFSGLGQKLKQHLEAERQGETHAAGPNQAEDEGSQAAARDVRAALERLAESLDDAFDALGKAAKDPTVRADVTEAGRALAGAIGTSFEQVGDEVRRVMERRKKGGSADPETDPGPGEADGKFPA